MYKKVFSDFVSTIAALFFLSSSAFAGQGSGKVTFLLINKDQVPAWVVFNIQNYTNHACATPNANLGRLIFTVDSASGRDMLALLLSAESRQIPVTAYGSGTCVSQNRETVGYISVGDPGL